MIVIFYFRKNPGAKRFDDDWEIPVISEETLDKLTTNCQPISSVLFLLSYDVQHFEILHHEYKLGLERKILQKV